MVSLKLQKRLAASVLKCGRGKVWLDPNEINEISMANSSKLLQLSLLYYPDSGRTSGNCEGWFYHPEAYQDSFRSRARRMKEAKRKGRHSGYGKRKGTREARLPTKILWMRRMRSLFKYMKQKVEALDKKNCAYTYNVIECDASMKKLEKITYETKMEACPADRMIHLHGNKVCETPASCTGQREKRFYSFSVIEGHVLSDKLEKISDETRFDPAQNGGSGTIVKVMTKFHTIGDIELKELVQTRGRVFQAVENYIVANPDA
ncbi:hypothetical protein GQ457_01G030300 [Hibiscus cannabinus]